MKQLALQSEAYRYIVRSFGEWLATIGYSGQTVYQLPIYIQELLYYAESKGYTGLCQLDNALVLEHYQRLKKRPNQRRGGGLSNNYLNKHQEAYKKFTEYLRHSGKMTLPPVDLSTEQDEDRVTAIITPGEVEQLYEITRLPYEPVKNDRGLSYYEAMQLRDRAMLTVFYGCGLRRNEGYHLDVSDIYFDKALLLVRKGKNYKETFCTAHRWGYEAPASISVRWAAILPGGKERGIFLSPITAEGWAVRCCCYGCKSSSS